MIFRCHCGYECAVRDKGDGVNNYNAGVQFAIHEQIHRICDALTEGRVEAADKARLDTAMAQAKRFYRTGPDRLQ